MRFKPRISEQLGIRTDKEVVKYTSRYMINLSLGIIETINFISSHPGTSTTEISKQLNIVYSHIHSTVLILSDLKFIEIKKVGRTNKIYPNHILHQYCYPNLSSLKRIYDTHMENVYRGLDK